MTPSSPGTLAGPSQSYAAGSPRAIRPVPRALVCAALCAVAAVAGLVIAAHHPLGGVLACVLFAGWAVLGWAFPQAWLALLPALMPVASLAPWSGWVVLDEFDLLLLATAAGVHARRALRLARSELPAVAPLRRGPRVLAWALGLWTLLALGRGLLDAGGAPGWFDAYLQPLNAWRAAKPLFFLLLLLQPLHEALQLDPRRALRRLRVGMLAGTALFVGAVLWERAALAGLLEFGSAYRTTALFWEMHVGGAAIDAYVAMAMPFAMWALWRLRRPLPWCLAALVAVGTVYAALTTYSRGVYGAVALPLLLPLGWLVRWRVRHGALRGLLLAALLTLAALLPLSWAVQALQHQGVALLLGLWLLAAVVVWRCTRIGWRAAAGVTLAVVLLAEVVTVMDSSGDGFMRRRLNASAMDLQARIAHWERGWSLLKGPREQLLGLGAGRLPAHYARAGGHPPFSGDVRLQEGGVRMDGRPPGSRISGVYGLTQRVEAHPGPHRVEMRVRSPLPGRVLVKVCESWLLYDERCQVAHTRVRASAQWTTLELVLNGPLFTAPALPRMHVFMLTGLSGSLLVDDVRLYAGGVQLLRNGGFDDALARWWPTAQDYYVPWHIDNLYLEQWIERGALALLLFAALAGAALWRLARIARGRDAVAESAVFLGAALCGALLVGLFSSVMDMPRVAWLLWLLLWTALLLPRAPAPA
jgi:hypothetical protein